MDFTIGEKLILAGAMLLTAAWGMSLVVTAYESYRWIRSYWG